MIQILKNHRWAIILAFVASVIVASPQIYFRYTHPSDYQGIEVFGTGDERAWLSRVREVADGHPAMSNVYFKDGKGEPYIYQPLGSNIIAFLGKIFSLDINNTMLLSRFIFPAFVFLLIYGFAFFLSKNKLIALAVSSFLMLGNSLFARKAVFQMLGGDSPSVTYVNYTRPVNPLMTHLFFFSFLLCFWLFLERKQWRWGILSFLLLGLSFYDYFYTWTFLYSFLGALLVIFIFQKKWLDIKRICLVISASLLMAIPYFINLYQVIRHPVYKEVGHRLAFEGSSATLGLLAPLLFAIVLLFFPRKWKERYYFVLALAIAPLIVLNQQIITGKVLSNAHYHWYFHLPLAAIFLLLIFFHWVSLKKQSFFQKAPAIAIIAVSIFTAVWIQKASYAENEKNMVALQRYGPVMDWLSENSQKDEVVFSDSQTAQLIVIYTPLNVFYHSTAKYSLAATNERLANALFLYYRLDNVTGEQAKDVFFRDRDGISGALYGIYYRDTTGAYGNIPDELLLELVRKYQETFSLATSRLFQEALNKYEVKYLVWDKRDYPFWQIDQYQFLEKTAEIGDFVIYRKI